MNGVLPAGSDFIIASKLMRIIFNVRLRVVNSYMRSEFLGDSSDDDDDEKAIDDMIEVLGLEQENDDDDDDDDDQITDKEL